MSKFNRWLTILLCMMMICTSGIGDFAPALAEEQAGAELIAQVEQDDDAPVPDSPADLETAVPPESALAPSVEEVPDGEDVEKKEEPAPDQAEDGADSPSDSATAPEMKETEEPVLELGDSSQPESTVQAPAAVQPENTTNFREDASKSPDFSFGYAKLLDKASLYKEHNSLTDVLAEVGKDGIVLVVDRRTDSGLDRLKVAFACEQTEVGGWVDATILRPMAEDEVTAFQSGIQEAILYNNDVNYPLPEPAIVLPEKTVEEPNENQTTEPAQSDAAQNAPVENAAPTENTEAAAPEIQDTPLETSPEGSAGSDEKTEAVLSLANAEMRLKVGDTATIEAVFADGVVRGLAYMLSNSGVVEISPEGVVTAVSAGTAKITVKCEALSESVVLDVTVEESEPAQPAEPSTPSDAQPAVTAIALEPAALELVVGAGAALKATITPETEAEIAFSSTDEKIATVDKDGKVTAVAVGSCEIIAAVGDVSAKATVKVVVPEVELNAQSVELTVSKTFQLSAKINNEGATLEGAKYASADVAIAKVSDTGLVTAVSSGQTKITLTLASGATAECVVNVRLQPDRLVVGAGTVNIIKGRIIELPVQFVRDDGQESDTIYSLKTSSSKYVAVNGTQIKGVKAGSATVTVTAYNGVSTKVKVTVWEKPTKVIMDVKSISTGEGMTGTVRARVYYGSKSFIYSAVDAAGIGTFSTGDSRIATVDVSGKITGVSKGSTYVRFTTHNGKSVQIPVTILGKPTVLNLSRSEATIGVGDKLKLTATFGSYEMGDVSYDTADKSIATVATDGTITAVAKGETTIIATVNGLEKTCKVKVVPAPAKVEIPAGTVNIIKGRIAELPVTVTNTDGDVCETTLTLKTSNKKYVAVNGTQIKGVKAGSATVTVTAYNGVSTKVKVTVWEKPTKVVMDVKSISTGEGMTGTVRARVYYKKKSFIYSAADAAGIGTFSIGDSKIATVDANGKITGLTKGSTYVRFTTYNGKSVQIPVTILGKPTVLNLSRSEATIGVGDRLKLTATFGPYEMGKVLYQTADPDVAAVTEDGTITAVTKGETTIIATVNGLTSTCRVKVVPAPAKVEIPAGTINIIKGRIMDVPVTVTNTDGDVCETTLTLKTSNKKYVAVNGTQIKGMKAGSATVTVTAYNGVSTKVKVTVWEKPTKVIMDVKSISIGEGMTGTVRARVYYKKKSFIYSAADAAGIGTFSIGDSKIATVDANGKITGLTKGSTYVRFTTYNGKSVQIPVTILGKPTVLNLSRSEATIGVGDRLKLTATFGPYEMGDVSYNTADKSIATVATDGTITAAAKGETTIIATVNGLEKTCKVKVVPAPAKVEIPAGTINIIKGRIMDVPVTVTNTDGDVCETTLTLKTSNKKYVAVNGTQIKGVKAGSATVTVTAYNGVSTKVKVTVWEKPTKVIMDVKSITIGEDTSGQVRARVYYKKKSFIYSATDAAGIGTFSIGDSKIATVDASGKVKGVAKGTTYVRFTTYNGKAVQIPVYVKSAPTVLNLDKSDLTLGVAMSYTLRATLGADEIGTIAFSSSDESVAVVDGNGKVTAKSTGTAFITAETISKTGEKLSKSCSLRVVPAPDKIELNMTSSNMPVKGKVQLTAKCTYQGSECLATLSYASSNKKIATVDASGRVTGVKAGSATIRVQAQNGVYADCKVVVRKTPTKVVLSSKSYSLGVGQTFTLQGRIYYSGGNFLYSKNDTAMAVFESSNPNVVTIDASGKVTAVGAGKANLRLRTYNGKGASTYCQVTVTAGPAWVSFTELESLMSVGQQTTLRCDLSDNAAKTDLAFTSSDTSVARVTGGQDGCTLNALKVGEAVITVKTSNGATATHKVKVYAAPTAAAFEASEVTIGANEQRMLPKVTVSAGGQECLQNVTYDSSDAGVASVNNSGRVVGTKAGTAVITATTYNGVKATCAVKVLAEPKTVTIQPDAATLAVGDTTQLRVTLDTTGTYTYAVEDESILTVDNNGVATALKSGTTKVQAIAYNGAKGECTITVKNTPDSITFNQATLTLGVGMTAKLSANIPENTLGRYAFASSDESVATVDAQGVVTAKAPGNASISVGIEGHDSVFDTCELTVQAMPSQIKLSAASLDMKTGATAWLRATLGPDANCYGSVTYTSDNASVATVSETGLVTAVKAGTATITAASTADGKVIATCTVKVEDAKVRLSESQLTLGVGETFRLEIIKTGSEALTIASSADGIAAMTDDGTITAKAQGEATITVSCGGETAQCVVKVLGKPDSVSIASTAKKLVVGKSFDLNAALPENTASQLTYKSADPAVAKVSAEGVVTAVGCGTTSITVSTFDAAVSAACTVTVVYEPEMIRFAELDDIIVAAGDQYILQAPVMFNADGDCDAAYTLSVSNSNCASVSVKDGRYVITAKAAGSATLRLKTANGKTATRGLIVVQKPDSMSFESASVLMGLGESWTPVIAGNNGAILTTALASSNSGVVRVEENGSLVAAGKGKATVTATAAGIAGLTAKVEIEVVEPTKTLTMSESTYRMGVGESHHLTVSAEAGAAALSVRYASSDETVVNVDQNGRIRAVGVGKAVITASTANDVSAKCEVTVSPMATQLSLSPKTIVASFADQVQLTRTYGNENEYANVVFDSSNPEVAAVSETGLVTFNKIGEAVITAETYNGLSADVAVKVCATPTKVNFAVATASILLGDKANLEVLFDQGAGYYVLESSNPSVLAITADGEIEAKQLGSATVTLKMPAMPQLTAKCEVKVIEKATGIAAVVEKNTLELGEQTTVTYQLLPADLLGVGNAQMVSSNPAIATVDEETGIVTGVSYGTVEISVTVGSNVDKVTVNVLGGKRRAFVAYWFGETGDPGYLPFAWNNGTSVVEAFSRATVEGQRYSVAGPYSNASKSTLYANLDAHFADATENDVSVIYLCSHGIAGYDSEYHFATPQSVKVGSTAGEFYANELMDHIIRIKGHVVVIMDSCASGGLIDCTRSRLNAEGGRISVLCSSHRNTSSSFYSVTTKNKSVDFYTFALLDGLGYNESAGLNGRAHGFYTTNEPADTNKDGVVTVQEMFNYADWKTIECIATMQGGNTFKGDKNQDPQSYIGSMNADVAIFSR